MASKLKYISLNEQQFNIMSQAITKESYEWEQTNLDKKLMGSLPSERVWYDRYKENISEEEIKQNSIVDEINKLIDKYNRNICTTSKKMINEIKNKYEELYSFGTIQNFYTRESDIEDSIVFNKVFLISGIGGIGKSQYMYDFGKTLRELKSKHLLIYGKYSDSLGNKIFDEIKNEAKIEKFYFLIDAINEFNSNTRTKILKFINENKSNENLRFIITYREHSLQDTEYVKLKNIATEKETFTGVSTYDAIEKISEKYNVDLSLYEHLLNDSNPYHLKLAVNFISDNILITDRKKPLEKGTYIYENMIKKALNKTRWNQTKQIVRKVIEIKEKRLPINTVVQLLESESNNYINEMKTKAFIDTYNYDGNDYLVFLNESLVDYLIARTMFDSIKEYDVKSIVKLIDEEVHNFYSISEPLILMIFEKFNRNIDDALYIIKNSRLIESFSLEIFNELSLSKTNQQYICKKIKPNIEIREMLLKAGGQHTNPFNCVNYLNILLFTQNKLVSSFNYTKYEVMGIRNKLKIWTRSIAKHDYNNLYLEEKFWFAFWMSSVPNGQIRFLARKLIFEITKINNNYIDILINSYDKINDDYIQEAIIHVLSTLQKKNKKIVFFFKSINTIDMININNMYHIHTYLYGKENYINYKKEDVLLNTDKYFSEKIFKFFYSVDFSFKNDYRMFGLDVYGGSKGNIHFNDKFLKEKKTKISKLNKMVASYFDCRKNECPAHSILRDLLEFLYSNISKEEVSSNKIYLAWQLQFKKFMKKYKIKLDDLEKRVFEPDEKNNIYKALELSIANTVGSIASNYYTNEFCPYVDGDLGYVPYLYDFYKEQPALYYPISVYNEDIDNLDSKIIAKVVIPNKKTKAWANNYKLSIQNLRNVVEPITYKKEEWRLIYGSIKRKEKSMNNRDWIWSDEYILNLAVNESYELTNNANKDRKYTIETPDIHDSLENIKNYDFSRTSSIKNSSEYRDIFVETDFNVPPIQIIKNFKLSYNRYNSSWINNNGEEVILVNNNKGSWYDDGLTGSIYIKEKYFQKLIKKYSIKYFAFTERFWKGTGYQNDSALQVELYLNNTEKYYKHYTSKRNHKSLIPKVCLVCPLYKEEIKQQKKWKNSKFNITMHDLLD